MGKSRALLTAVLGLMLWVQGLAVAAAPVELAASTPDSAMEMPCHGDAAPGACDCCDGDCPDMASCAAGHVFAAAPAAVAPDAGSAHVIAAAGGWSAKTAVLSLPVRPPIAFHA